MSSLFTKFKPRGGYRFIAAFLMLAFILMQWQHVIAADAALVNEAIEESAIEISNRLTERMDLYREQIGNLETEFGPFDRALLEPLQSLTELIIETGDLVEVDRILKRRLQLIRTTDGPESLTQFSTLAELIRNDIRRNRWQEVTETFEHIYWLQSQDPDAEISTVLEARNAIIAWHFTAIYIDDPNRRTRHFRDAAEIYRQLLRTAQSEFGEESPALIPWLYQDALELFRVKAFFESKDELGGQARRDIVWLESRRHGLNQVKRIRRIVELMDDPEAEAMAMIYEGDFLMLLEIGTAPRQYRNAMEKLEEAGIDREKVEAFFARPQVLPAPEFYFSMDEALAAQDAYGYTVEPGGEDSDDVIHMGDFVAWNESLPYAGRPEIPELASSVSRELYAVDVTFSIDSVGNVRTARAQQAEPDEVRIRVNAQNAIEAMQFRPKFGNGRGYRARDVTMRYLYPPPF